MALATVMPACTSVAPTPSSSKTSDYKIVNLGPAFEKFWSLAENKRFTEQLEIWNRIVERPYQSFYDGMVWQRNDNPKWEERKMRRLKVFFPKYKSLHDKMKSQFDLFDEILKNQIDRFVQVFPDAHFDLPIYAAPTTTFNGKGGEGGDSGDPLSKTVLAFGIDMIVDRNDNPDVLYAHELFHIYHTAAAGVNEKVFLNEGKLTLPLWLEGLATYVSQQMNPQAPLTDVLMDKDLPLVTERQIRSLAKNFLVESGEKAFDPAKPEIYKKWFAIDPQFNLGPKLPQRCGYLLGLKVSERLAKKHKLQDMVHWNVAKAHQQVLNALHEIATGR
jgi:hypothetical protein